MLQTPSSNLTMNASKAIVLAMACLLLLRATEAGCAATAECRISQCLPYCSGFKEKAYDTRTCLLDGEKSNVCDDLACKHTSKSEASRGCFCCCGWL